MEATFVIVDVSVVGVLRLAGAMSQYRLGR